MIFLLFAVANTHQKRAREREAHLQLCGLTSSHYNRTYKKNHRLEKRDEMLYCLQPFTRQSAEFTCSCSLKSLTLSSFFVFCNDALYCCNSLFRCFVRDFPFQRMREPQTEPESQNEAEGEREKEQERRACMRRRMEKNADLCLTLCSQCSLFPRCSHKCDDNYNQMHSNRISYVNRKQNNSGIMFSFHSVGFNWNPFVLQLFFSCFFSFVCSGSFFGCVPN